MVFFVVVFSNIAQSSTEVMDVVKDCHQTFVVVFLWFFLRWCSGGVFVVVFSNIAQSFTEVMAVVKDCHQTSPKVLLKSWLSSKIVIKHRPKFY